MRFLALISLLVVCLAGNMTATTVLVYISEREAVIATDSLANRTEGGWRSVCKIGQVSETLLFAEAGIGRTEVPYFDPYEIAQSVGKGISPHQAAERYVAAALPGIRSLWRLNLDRYVQIVRTAGQPRLSGPQSFVFVGLDENRLISFSRADFTSDPTNALEVIVSNRKDRTAGHANTYLFYAFGVITSLSTNDDINRSIATLGPIATLRHAIEKQESATPRLVGGPISIVRLQRDGSVEWEERGKCERPPWSQ